MVDIDLIRRKLSRLNMYIEELMPISRKGMDEYKKDSYLRFSAERLIQLIVECATDINSHVIVEIGNRPPEDYRSSFINASKTGLISAELSDKLKGSAGMRNILVHDYMEVDDEKVFNVIPTAVKDYKEYIKQVDRFLEKLSE